jgi:hypothetical protein
MGGTTSSSVDWGAYSSSSATRSKTLGSTFTASTVKPEYDPAKIKVRESFNSDANPASTPVIIALDCTGSMGDLAVSAVKNIGTLMKEIYDRKPVTDPHIMAMFFDDVYVSPTESLQVTQFEADKVIIDQLESLKFVSNGGGNRSESSTLPWHFALHKTDIQAFKEGRKGFLFTIGDDGVPPTLTADLLKRVYGPDADADLLAEATTEDMLNELEENWHVFNIIPTRGHSDNWKNSEVFKTWEKVLGERTILLTDINKLAEVLVATMQVVAGADAATVAASFKDPGTALVVQDAVGSLTPGRSTATGVARL